MGTIALEEHFVVDEPAHVERWMSLIPNGVPRVALDAMRARLADVGEARLQAMGDAGIELAVLSSVASVQGVGLDAASALALARSSNEHLARIVDAHPGRFAGFASIPLLDPAAGAHELERAVRELGLKGAMIFGHTAGVYLDDPVCYPLWEAAEALGVPVYLHAADGPAVPPSYEGRPELLGATWSWTAETATHALRIVLGGVFDRFPGAQLILGHLGETLPFLLWRTDRQIANRPLRVDRDLTPSEVIRRNVMVTTSGVFSDPPFLCALSALGVDRVMFSVDHPFEDGEVAAGWFRSAPIAEDVRSQVGHKNARRLLGTD